MSELAWRKWSSSVVCGNTTFFGKYNIKQDAGFYNKTDESKTDIGDQFYAVARSKAIARKIASVKSRPKYVHADLSNLSWFSSIECRMQSGFK